MPQSLSLTFWLLVTTAQLPSASPFSSIVRRQPCVRQGPTTSPRRLPQHLSSNANNNNSNNNNNPSNEEEVFDLDTLQQRLIQMQIDSFEQEVQLPPNPHLSSKDFVRQLLRALWDNSNPLPDTGFRVLLRSSTPLWRHCLFHSVGAPDNAQDEVVASALGEAIGRPNNQFAILVDDGETISNNGEPPFVLDFPTDVVDYGDGTCWLECRLRARDNGELLVAMGWQLQRQSVDGAWLVDQMDWQDFRDEYRPGIGREEWMRICG